MKKIIWIIVIVVVLGGVFLWNNTKDKTEKIVGEKMKVGAILPLTGPIASAGEFAKQGIEEAIKDIASDDISNIEVVFEDGQYDAKAALAAYNKLKSVDKVKALIVFGTPSAMALAPVANTDKMPMLALVGAPAYSTPNDFTYRMFGTSDVEAKFASDVLVDQLGKKKIAVLYLNNDYGTGALASLKKYIGSRATVIAAEGSAPGTTDYRAQLTKIKSLQPDAIFMATLYKEGGLIIKQAKEMGLQGPFMCGQPCDVPEVITTGGPASEGLIVVTPTSQGDDTFIERYKKTYNNAPSYIALRTYDATKILNHISPKCINENFSGECIKSQVDSLKDFPGLSYKINFDENGDINDQFILKVVKNGVHVPYE